MGRFGDPVALQEDDGIRDSVYWIRGGSEFVDADFVNCSNLQHEVE